eukprot:3165680-Rhodomonas_salina.1
MMTVRHAATARQCHHDHDDDDGHPGTFPPAPESVTVPHRDSESGSLAVTGNFPQPPGPETVKPETPAAAALLSLRLESDCEARRSCLPVGSRRRVAKP